MVQFEFRKSGRKGKRVFKCPMRFGQKTQKSCEPKTSTCSSPLAIEVYKVVNIRDNIKNDSLEEEAPRPKNVLVSPNYEVEAQHEYSSETSLKLKQKPALQYPTLDPHQCPCNTPNHNQGPSSSYTKIQPLRTPENQESPGDTLYSNKTPSPIASDPLTEQIIEQQIHELDTSYPLIPQGYTFDPQSAELYTQYKKTGKIDRCISKLPAPLFQGKSYGWQHCWSLINAYLFGVQIRDYEFSDRIMNILSRSIAPGAPADADTINYLFINKAPTKIRNFVVDRCLTSGVNFMNMNPIDMKLPEGFVQKAFLRAFEVIDEGKEVVLGKGDGCRYHIHHGKIKCYKVSDQERGKDQKSELVGEVGTVPAATQAADNQVSELDGSNSVIPQPIIVFCRDEAKPCTVVTAKLVTAGKAKLT